jgi:hypothetical protein
MWSLREPYPKVTARATKSVFCKVYAPLTRRFSIRRIIAISIKASLLHAALDRGLANFPFREILGSSYAGCPRSNSL